MTETNEHISLPGSLVSGEWLEARLGDPRLAIIDIRGYVKSVPVDGGEPGHERSIYTGAPDEYAEGHVPGSVFIDWTQDIIDPDDPVHVQIAQPDAFASTMGASGVGNDTAVVVVDHTGGTFAGRLWWALKYHGHDNVALLEGGWNRWISESRPVTSEQTTVAPAVFTPNLRPELRSTAEDVLESISSSEAVIVDARDTATFTGKTWRGPRKGHIPGAVNVPSKSLVNDDGTWMGNDELEAIFSAAGITRETPVISYCNGGVSATGVLIALDRIGHDKWSNYDGSWNEWGEREDLPVEI